MPSAENLADLASQGYLPTDIDTVEGVVSLVRLGHAGFQEVWYDDTVVGADKEDTRVVPFSVFVEQFAERQDGERLNLIAHTSRCGSTLLANLLRLRPTTMVLKEPDFVTIPVRRIVLAQDAAETWTWDSLLTALLNFSCHAASGAGRELVIKLTSWNAPVVMASLRGRGNTTWLFSWREPEPVVASNRATPPSWGKETENGRAARLLTGVADIATGSVEFYANIWRRIVDSFLSADHDLRWRALEYQDLASEKAASLLAAESWFGLSPTAELPDEFDQESRRYSKGPRGEDFEPAKTHVRDPLEPWETRTVSTITQETLEALRQAKNHWLL